MPPSCAEEYACAETASLLLINEEGNMTNNDEGVFAKEITSDGDIIGGAKFVNKKIRNNRFKPL